MERNDLHFFALSAMPAGELSNFVTPSPALKKIVKMVVIWGSASDFTFRIYRDSSRAKGLCSCDEYRFISGKLQSRVAKDKNKYSMPEIPRSANQYTILGHTVYTENPLDDKTINAIEKLLSKLY